MSEQPPDALSEEERRQAIIERAQAAKARGLTLSWTYEEPAQLEHAEQAFDLASRLLSLPAKGQRKPRRALVPAKRGAKGDGSIYQGKDGRWVAQLQNPATGKRIYKTSRDKAVVKAWLAETLQRFKKGRSPINERLTVGRYLEDWLSTAQARHNLQPSSIRRYRELLRIHIIPQLGGAPLARLSVREVSALYTQKKAELSPATVRALHGAFRVALQDAVADELIDYNRAEQAKPKFGKRPKRPFLTPEQANHLLAAAAGDRWEALYWLALNTGMRESELLALRWSDVDLARKELRIRVSKTEAGIRSPGLIGLVVTKLREHKARMQEERLQKGPRWLDQGPFEQGLVFPNTVGHRQYGPDFLTRYFYPLLERAGLPKVHLHDLRHTTVSWLLSLNIPPVDVAHFVGHANAATTLGVYAHSLPNSQQAILDAFERALQGGEKHG